MKEDECESCEDIMATSTATQNTERINQIEETQEREQHLYAGMMVENNLLKFQIDSGATCSVIPVHLLDPYVKMEHTDKVLVMFYTLCTSKKTFAIPFGRFCWLRMPMGSFLFQKFSNGSWHKHWEVDDILITGEGDSMQTAGEDHDRKLRLSLQRCRERNIKLNADIFKLRKQDVAYIGHLLTTAGLKVDPEKVRATTEMLPPTDTKGVQILVGMVNYLSKFYESLSDYCEILRQLTLKENLWEWTAVQEKAFQFSNTIGQRRS